MTWVLRWAVAIVVLSAVVAICVAAVLVGLLHPNSSPRRALDALGEFNREAARLIGDLRSTSSPLGR